jgi:hypothetical protein
MARCVEPRGRSRWKKDVRACTGSRCVGSSSGSSIFGNTNGTGDTSFDSNSSRITGDQVNASFFDAKTKRT